MTLIKPRAIRPANGLSRSWALQALALASVMQPGCASKPPASTAAPAASLKSAAADSAPEAKAVKASPPAAAPKPDPMTALGYRLEWKGAAVIARRARVDFVEAYPDAVVVMDSSNLVTVLEPQTGRLRWSAELGGDLIRFVGLARDGSGNLIACSETEALILNSRTGELIARQRFAELANTKPLVVDNMLVVGCINGHLLGHNMLSGYKQWAYQLTGAIEAAPVMAGGEVAAVSTRGDVVAVNPLNGQSSGRGTIYGAMTQAPAANDRAIFLAGQDQSVWSLSRYTGAPVWRVRTPYPITDRPALLSERLYVAIPNDGLACFEAETGTRIWTSEGRGGSIIGVRSGRLLGWDGRKAYTLDAVTGDLAHELEPRNPGVVLTDALTDGNLYLVAPDGRIEKYSPR